MEAAFEAARGSCAQIERELRRRGEQLALRGRGRQADLVLERRLGEEAEARRELAEEDLARPAAQ